MIRGIFTFGVGCAMTALAMGAEQNLPGGVDAAPVLPAAHFASNPPSATDIRPLPSAHSGPKQAPADMTTLTPPYFAQNRKPANIPPLPERFQILLKRSLFATNGEASSAASPEAEAAAATAAAATKGAMPVLRGVVLQEGAYTAVFENPATHQTQSVKEGEPLAGGRVGNITLRGFQFIAEDKRVEVAIGQNLRGEAVAAPMPPPPGPAMAKGQPNAPPNAPPGGPDPAAPNGPVAVQAGSALPGTTPEGTWADASPTAGAGHRRNRSEN